MIAPVLAYVAVTVGSTLSAGTTTALWICFGLSAGGAVVGVSLYALGRVRPPTPAFEHWLAGEGPAWDSPPLLAAVRAPSTEARPAERAKVDVRHRRLLGALGAVCQPPPISQSPVPDGVSASQTGHPS
jgi:hypothetical protein